LNWTKVAGAPKPLKPEGSGNGNAPPPARSSVLAWSSRLTTCANTVARVWNGAGGAVTEVSVTIGIESWVCEFKIIR
jgi:hypothetical protein